MWRLGSSVLGNNAVIRQIRDSDEMGGMRCTILSFSISKQMHSVQSRSSWLEHSIPSTGLSAICLSGNDIKSQASPVSPIPKSKVETCRVRRLGRGRRQEDAFQSCCTLRFPGKKFWHSSFWTLFPPSKIGQLANSFMSLFCIPSSPNEIIS